MRETHPRSRNSAEPRNYKKVPRYYTPEQKLTASDPTSVICQPDLTHPRSYPSHIFLVLYGHLSASQLIFSTRLNKLNQVGLVSSTNPLTTCLLHFCLLVPPFHQLNVLLSLNSFSNVIGN